MAKYGSCTESRSSARFVPCTRVLIFAKAMSLDVDVSSAKGREPAIIRRPQRSQGNELRRFHHPGANLPADSTLELMG